VGLSIILAALAVRTTSGREIDGSLRAPPRRLRLIRLRRARVRLRLLRRLLQPGLRPSYAAKDRAGKEH